MMTSTPTYEMVHFTDDPTAGIPPDGAASSQNSVEQSTDDFNTNFTPDIAALNQDSLEQSLLTPRTDISAHAASSQPLSNSHSYHNFFGLKDLFRHDNFHGQSPLAMLLCLILGGIFAVSHHLFYNHLNSTLVRTKDDQEWALRFGNAFALATKTALGVAVAIAYTQHIWTTFRRKSITVKGIDAITAAPNDVFALLDREMWLKNPSGTIIAGLLW